MHCQPLIQALVVKPITNCNRLWAIFDRLLRILVAGLRDSTKLSRDGLRIVDRNSTQKCKKWSIFLGQIKENSNTIIQGAGQELRNSMLNVTKFYDEAVQFQNKLRTDTADNFKHCKTNGKEKYKACTMEVWTKSSTPLNQPKLILKHHHQYQLVNNQLQHKRQSPLHQHQPISHHQSQLHQAKNDFISFVSQVITIFW